jgi:hypothetical protein
VRASAIALAGLFGLIVLFLIVIYPQLLLLFLSGIVCLLIVLGFRVFPSFKKQIPVVLNPIERGEVGAENLEAQTGETPRLEGKPFPVIEPTQRFTLSIRLKNLPMLLATGIIALASFTVGLGGKIGGQIELLSARYMEVYALGYFSFFFLAVAGLWLNERAILGNLGVAIGAIQRPPEGRPTGRWLAYYFRDESGHYHGATRLSFGKHTDDNSVLVLFNHAHPDWSKPSSGFIFHRIELIFPRGKQQQV